MYWLVSIASLAGVWFNVRKHVACFYLWAASNATWAYVDLANGLEAQAALQAVYFVLSLWGIWSWSTWGGGGKGGTSCQRGR